jgi:4'-phosphopantetheinyl transferase
VSPFLHIWLADLTADAPGWPAAETSLSATELARLARLRTPTLRQTYARAHSFLRDVLGQYVGRPLAAAELATSANGKPTLAHNSLSFNLSYRPGRALLALSNAGPVGADLEPLVPHPDAAPLVAELFSPGEQAALHAAAAVDYWRLFHLIWTRKEAYAKALGMGLALPFREFSVLAPGRPPRPTAPADTSLLSFPAGMGWQGAMAVLTAGGMPAPQHFQYLPGIAGGY